MLSPCVLLIMAFATLITLLVVGAHSLKVFSGVTPIQIMYKWGSGHVMRHLLHGASLRKSLAELAGLLQSKSIPFDGLYCDSCFSSLDYPRLRAILKRTRHNPSLKRVLLPKKCLQALDFELDEDDLMAIGVDYLFQGHGFEYLPSMTAKALSSGLREYASRHTRLPACHWILQDSAISAKLFSQPMQSCFSGADAWSHLHHSCFQKRQTTPSTHRLILVRQWVLSENPLGMVWSMRAPELARWAVHLLMMAHSF